MNTLATCTARFTRAWMSVFALILLVAPQSAFAATATLVPVAGANVTLARPANNAPFIALVTISLTATVADTEGVIAKIENYNRTALAIGGTAPSCVANWKGVPAVGYSFTTKATDDINLHFVYDESGRWVGKYTPNGTLLQKTVYFGDLPVAVLL